jgi:hypothetical protein
MRLRNILAAAALATACLPGLAAAATFSGSWSVDANAADPGLVVRTAPAAPHFAADLEVGESRRFDLFHIWTDEADVAAREDTARKPISVGFSFSDPIAWGAVSGETAGERIFGGLVQQGRLSWDGPLVLNFGERNSGRLTLALSDAIFNKGMFGLGEGYRHGATVAATLTYDVAPVPLPAALPMLLGGLGLIGAVARRRRGASLA